MREWGQNISCELNSFYLFCENNLCTSVWCRQDVWTFKRASTCKLVFVDDVSVSKAKSSHDIDKCIIRKTSRTAYYLGFNNI